MRPLICAMAIWVCALPAHAAPDMPDVQDLAYAGDVAGVEAAFAQAHAAQLSGAVDLDVLRDMNGILLTSHPDMLAFQQDWLAAYPESPYALTLRASALTDAAFAARGSEFVVYTHPDALDAFRDLSDRALDLALRAVDVDPDYVPAIDALLDLQVATGWLSDEEKFDLTAHVMDLAPNLVTLQRALHSSLTTWGGAGPSEITRYCDAFAARIPTDPGFTADVCIARIVGWHRVLGPLHDEAKMLADVTGHKNLGGLRRMVAMERGTPEDRDLILTYLRGPGARDWRTAWDFSGHFGTTPEIDAMFRAIDRRSMAGARAWLPHDPFDIATLDYLLNPGWTTGAQGYNHPRMTEAERVLLLKRRAVASPFEAQSLYDVGRFLYLTTWDYALADPYLMNAIYYSSYAPYIINLVLDAQRRGFPLEVWAPPPAGAQPSAAAVAARSDTARICPFIHTMKLIEFVCDFREDPTCANHTPVLPDVWVLAAAEEDGLCEAERASTAADLAIEPVKLSTGDLLAGIANRGDTRDPAGFSIAP